MRLLPVGSFGDVEGIVRYRLRINESCAQSCEFLLFCSSVR